MFSTKFSKCYLQFISIICNIKRTCIIKLNLFKFNPLSNFHLINIGTKTFIFLKKLKNAIIITKAIRVSTGTI